MLSHFFIPNTGVSPVFLFPPPKTPPPYPYHTALRNSCGANKPGPKRSGGRGRVIVLSWHECPCRRVSDRVSAGRPGGPEPCTRRPVKTAPTCSPPQCSKRWERDSNPRDPDGPTGFQDRRIQPLCHPTEIRPILSNLSTDYHAGLHHRLDRNIIRRIRLDFLVFSPARRATVSARRRGRPGA